MKHHIDRTWVRGMSLLEVSVVVGITLVILMGAGTFISLSFKDQKILDDQLYGQREARRIVTEITNVVRTAEASSVGSYPIATATTSTLTLYANIDSDSLRERVRYWVTGTELRRGILKPSGNPLAYTGTENVTVLAHDVENIVKGIDTFQYFDENYIGTSAPLPFPIVLPNVRMVRVVVQIEKEESRSPVPIRVESITQIRNLKTN